MLHSAREPPTSVTAPSATAAPKTLFDLKVFVGFLKPSESTAGVGVSDRGGLVVVTVEVVGATVEVALGVTVVVVELTLGVTVGVLVVASSPLTYFPPPFLSFPLKDLPNGYYYYLPPP